LGFHDVQDLFTVVVQVGAIGAVVWFFWRDLLDKVAGLFRRQLAALKFWLLLVVGTIPAGIVGLMLDSSMQRFTTPLVVAVALIIGGVVLWVVDRKPVTRKQPVQEVDIAKISLKRALLIGLGQCVAIVPGVSRSGA